MNLSNHLSIHMITEYCVSHQRKKYYSIIIISYRSTISYRHVDTIQESVQVQYQVKKTRSYTQSNSITEEKGKEVINDSYSSHLDGLGCHCLSVVVVLQMYQYMIRGHWNSFMVGVISSGYHSIDCLMNFHILCSSFQGPIRFYYPGYYISSLH